ncbi:MAG TPA: DUF4175 family protein, partial [Bacteroidales bacterium]|nr:DUF4175 family protein [Bacteroidales bacterium]
MQEGYQILIEKLNRFRRKYYFNQMLRGAIWFVAVFAVFFLLVNLFEYYSWSSPDVRTTLFYTYLFINLFILARLVIIPLLKLFRVGRIMDEEEAARLVGAHFPEVNDKLLNTIQLKKLSETNGTLALLQAGIEQKTRALHPVPFVRAIELSKNRKYLRYAIPPVLIILVLLFSAPATITEPSKRLIHHRSEYAKPLPFSLTIMNSKLEAVQQEDFTLNVKTVGEELPASMQLLVNGSVLSFQKTGANTFAYTFNNLQQDLSFSILAEGFGFGPYSLKVMPKPIIINYELSLDYPAYTGKKDEVFQNTGDFVVPEGTVVAWRVATRDTRALSFRMNNRIIKLEAGSSNTFTHSEKLMESLQYSISVENEFMSNPDTLSYAITVIPDLFPTAIFEEFRDSVYEKRLYFQGQISDDYGFSDLTFNYEFLNHFDSARMEGKVYKDPVGFSAAVTKQMIFHHFDLGTLNVGPGDEVAYYFEVWDNDGINGRKSSRSHRMVFRAPTLDEIGEQTEAENSKIKDEMEDIIDEARMLQKQIEKLNRQLINKESLSWQDKEQIRNMLQQQEQLHNRMELLQEKNLEKTSREQEYKQENQNILEKQQELQKLFDEVMTDEMKKLFEELQKLLDEMRKEDVNEMLEKMEMNASDIEQELDRNLELFKQLEFDKKLTETIEKLQELAEKQEALSEKSEEKNADSEQLEKEQQSLNESFEKLREDMDDIEKLNEELENKHELQDTEEQENSIQEEMENSMDKLKEGQMKKAGQSQKKAGDEMKKLAEMMLNMQMSMYAESNAEDIMVLREILENLLVISFDQEDLIGELGNINVTDPRYQDLIQRQHEIKENMKIVEDSLYALSKRQTAIQPFVNKEVDNINKNIEDANE